MKRGRLVLLSALLLALPCLSLAQQADTPSDLRRAADNIKFENAMQFFAMRDYDKALREFDEYLEIYVNGAHRNEAHRRIARIYFDRFEYEKAIRAYSAICEESSTTDEGVEAYYRAGICHQKMGDDAKALEIFGAIIEQYPYSNYAGLSRMQMDLLKIISPR